LPPTARHRIHIPHDRSERIDRLLARSLPAVSRRRVQRLIEDGFVRIDGRPARKGDIVHGERWIDVELIDEPVAPLAAEPDPAIDVLFEDASCIVLDKPAGRPAHALRSGERGTVANFIAARFPECLTAADSPLEAGLAHRLDTETSGALLAARRRDAWLALRRQFRDGTVEKVYVAAVSGVVHSAGEIMRPIEPDPRNRRRVRVLHPGEASPRARRAITRYRPLAATQSATLLEVEIATGVMHQIRAHLASLGHAIVGDSRYGGDSIDVVRHLLHAHRIGFDHPYGGERITVTSPLPPDFLAALTRLRLQSPRLLLKV
jgi:23S rRNA pseudouridine1911/1915/1917 synthase